MVKINKWKKQKQNPRKNTKLKCLRLFIFLLYILVKFYIVDLANIILKRIKFIYKSMSKLYYDSFF